MMHPGSGDILRLFPIKPGEYWRRKPKPPRSWTWEAKERYIKINSEERDYSGDIKMSDYHEIALSSVEEGFLKSKNRCLRHLEGSKILILKSYLGGAAILAVFALEELGRMEILRQRYSLAIANSENHIKIKKRSARGRADSFYYHERKQQIALNLLPKGIEVIHKPSFSSSDFGEGFDTQPSFINQDLREAYTYTDYDSRWRIPPLINEFLLTTFIDELENVCKSMIFIS